MAYGNQNGGGSKGGYKRPAAGTSGAAPQQGGADKPAQGGSGRTGGGNKPDFDLVQVDEQGEIMKDADGKSIRVGAVWGKPGGKSMFVKLADGTRCKAFSTTRNK